MNASKYLLLKNNKSILKLGEYRFRHDRMFYIQVILIIDYTCR